MSPPLVAERAPLCALEVSCVEMLDLIELPGVSAGPVRCYACGSVASATHVVCAADGAPVGADTFGGLREWARREARRAESQ